MSISGDDLTSEDDSDEVKAAAADELEGEWMSDPDSGEEEGVYVISFVLVLWFVVAADPINHRPDRRCYGASEVHGSWK